MDSRKKPIVIVGAGFAGINAAFTLKRLNPIIPILVIDAQSKFIFKPLLYEVLSDEIKEWEVATEFDKLFSNSGITFLKNNLLSVNLEEKSLAFHDNLKIHYRYLILSTGSKNNTFSIKGVEEYCDFFNDINDLNRLKTVLAKSSISDGLKNIVIIGAGPSGVELACKIKDLYTDKYKVYLVEKSREILNNNKIYNREEAEKAIEERNIKLLIDTVLEEIQEDKVYLKDKNNNISQLHQDIVIWTAGIQPNLPAFVQPIDTINGKVVTNKKLQLKSYENVFVLGDISIIEGEEHLPSTAQNAMQQGTHVGKNIHLCLSGVDLEDYEFKDNGEMISLGIGKASFSGLGLTLSGKFAFELRRLVYASKMPVFRDGFKSAASWLMNKKNILLKLLK